MVFPRSLTTLVLEELRGGDRRRLSVGPLAGLTEREVEVLALMAEGHTNEVVGRTLHLSAKTIENSLSQIYGKLGVRSRVELAALVARSLR